MTIDFDKPLRRQSTGGPVRVVKCGVTSTGTTNFGNHVVEFLGGPDRDQWYAIVVDNDGRPVESGLSDFAVNRSSIENVPEAPKDTILITQGRGCWSMWEGTPMTAEAAAKYVVDYPLEKLATVKVPE